MSNRAGEPHNLVGRRFGSPSTTHNGSGASGCCSSRLISPARTSLPLRWSPDGGRSYRDIVRQQWNFSPLTATRELEDYHVELSGVTALELTIVPDQRGGEAQASLAQWRLA